MRLWRICKSAYAASAFSGEGSFLYSGRWNPRGIRMVYTATSPALAALELFVHTDPTQAPDDLVLISADLPPATSPEVTPPKALPVGWNTMDSPNAQSFGAAWIASGRSLALQVPSIVVPGDWNVLLNPAHPSFRSIVLHPAVPWRFDARMFRPRALTPHIK